MNILITGGSGFLGKYLSLHLRLKGHDVYAPNSTIVNLKDYDSIAKNLNYKKFDKIYHLAVKTAAGGYCQEHPGEQFLENQLTNTNILYYWKNKNPQAKMITFGTSCGYSDDVVKIEENYKIGQPETGFEVYGQTKRMLLLGLESLNKEFGLNYAYFIPTMFYGPGYDPKDKHFIFDIIRKIYMGKHFNESVILWGDGYQERELLYIEDAASILINDDIDGICNLSTGESKTIREYAQIICNILNYDFNKIQWDSQAFVGSRKKRLIPSNKISYSWTPIEIGIKKTIDYYHSGVKNGFF